MYSQVFLSLVFGSVLGFILSLFGPHHPHLPGFLSRYRVCRANFDKIETRAKKMEEYKLYGNKLLFIGVMTAAKYFDTRATAVNQTWASDISSGHVEFFMSFDNSSSLKGKQMPVKILHGVKDNEYPPQKKVIAMLRYMYENYIDQYEWFMRADDDVYVRTEKLVEFLRTLDSSKDIVVGQGGTGKSEEVNKLGLKKHECYCLGGPGVIMSRSVLRKMAPNMERCLQETASNHEDVELGRCIRKYAGVSCLWADEAKELFQQVYKDQQNAYHGVLNEAKINKALTLHPVKVPAYMFRLHFHFMSMKLSKLHYRGYKTNGILSTTKRMISGKIVPKSFVNRSRNTDFYFRANTSSNILEWEYLTQKKHSATIQVFDLRNQKTYLMFNKADGIKKALSKVMHELNRKYRKTLSRKTKSRVTFENTDYGYLRVNPKFGVQYQLALSLKFPHGPLKFPWHPRKPTTHYWTQVDQGFSTIQGRIQADIKRITVNFIVPLREKYEELRRFLASVREAFLIHSEPIAVLVVYFPESSSPTKHIHHINELKLEFPETKFVWLQIPGEFNRAKALQKGAEHLGNDSLLFFSDIDLVFRREFVYRCRSNTIRSKQVYMPLMFGQYNPDVVYFNKRRPKTNFVYTKSAGRWRIYSYGPVCIYGSDVMAVEGLNTNIKGWGKEDTDFASRVVKRGLTIFRAPDQGIVHVFHQHVPCDKSLADDQRYQCKMATLSTYAPKTEAVDYMIVKQYIKIDGFRDQLKSVTNQ